MKQAFVIMQIGNPDLDVVFQEVFVPASKNSGLEPKRVDKHNEGRLLKSEIVNFIQDSDIVIADLTNERPNCYLEIGYAMGLNKFRNLILTAREDHNPESANYRKEGPKVHFDLSGYDILFWAPNGLAEFKEALEKRIKRRLSTLPSYAAGAPSASPWDEEWIAEHRETAYAGLQESGKTGYMEMRMALLGAHINVSQDRLLQAAHASQIPTFGWPIGVVLDKEKFYPKPTADGIVAQIDSSELGGFYDYWTIRKDGSYYLLKSLFEDTRVPNSISFDTRIVRITEAFLYAVRLYTNLNVPPDTRLLIGFAHVGLKGRSVTATTHRSLGIHGAATVDKVYTEVETPIEKIECDLTDLVERVTKELFVVFDFFKIDKSVLGEIVDNFVDGRVT